MFTANSRRTQGGSSLMYLAYDNIKNAICTGAFSPGDLLSENRLAKELGMSRTPVREAIRILASEDFVEIRNGAGVLVKNISAEDVHSLMQVRGSLELLAAETSAFNITDGEIRALEQGFHSLLEEYRRNRQVNPHEFTSRDYELHRLIIERCDNKYVIGIMEGINAKIIRYQSLSFIALNNIEESTEQHLEILRRIKRMDVPALKEALALHIKWSEQCIADGRAKAGDAR